MKGIFLNMHFTARDEVRLKEMHPLTEVEQVSGRARMHTQGCLTHKDWALPTPPCPTSVSNFQGKVQIINHPNAQLRAAPGTMALGNKHPALGRS